MEEESMWQAVVNRDATKHGAFLYGVLTTGVYCQPGCSSRTPLRKNVRFYKNVEDAEKSGLRPCLRCLPTRKNNLTENETITAVRKYIRKHADTSDLISLDALGRKFQMSPSNLQRRFKAAVGLSPKKFAEEIRMEVLKENLRQGSSVTDAIYGAGFGSSSRLYEQANTQLGMTPMEYRDYGRGVDISYATMKTPLGLLMVGATDRGLCFLQFGKSKAELLESLRQEYSAADLSPMTQPPSEAYQAWAGNLNGFLAGEQVLISTPIVLHGTAFQRKVWQYLASIPSGHVQSYSEVAKGIGRPKAVRAVASACAANEIALFVPCHRVVRGNGELGGYRWGIDRKRTLLDIERQIRDQQVPAGHT